jgi:hypothetical protein
MENKKDIWSEGIKAIFGSSKRSLLDFIDMIPTSTSREKEIIGSIKGRIHNDLSSACLSVGAMMAAFRAGGDITPFEDTIIKKENNARTRADNILGGGKK